MTLAKFKLPSLMVILSGLLAGGCLDFAETITIRNNGEATVQFEYALDEGLVEAWFASQKQIEEWQGNPPVADRRKLDWILNESLARKYFRGNGITLERYTATIANGRHQVLIVCHLSAIHEGLATGKFGDFTLDRNDHGDYLFKADFPETDERPPATARHGDKLPALCRGLRMKLTVQVPGKILATSAPAQEDKSAVWEFDAAQNTDFLLKPSPITLTFSGKNVTLEQSPSTP